MEKAKLFCGICLVVGLLLGALGGILLGYYQSANQLSSLMENIHIDAVNVKLNETAILNALMPVWNESTAQTCAKLGYTE